MQSLELAHLTDRVRDLLAQQGQESSVERSDTLGAENLAEPRDHARSVLGVRDEADTSRLKGRKQDVCKESDRTASATNLLPSDRPTHSAILAPAR